MRSSAVAGLAGLLMLGPGRADGARPQADLQRQESEHLEIVYPVSAAEELRGFLSEAEGIYQRVERLLDGALPDRLRVALLSGEGSDSSQAEVRLDPGVVPVLEQRFAARLARLGVAELTGEMEVLEGHRFLMEGAVTWTVERAIPEGGGAGLRWRQAAYGYLQEAAYLEYLETFERAGEELGAELVSALAFSLVDVLVKGYGRDGLTGLLRRLGHSRDPCTALDEAGVGCDRLLDDWWAALEAEAAEADFEKIPRVRADLHAKGEGPEKALRLWVHIVNPESAVYRYYVHVKLDGIEWEEAYRAEGVEFESWVPLGSSRVGARVMWNVSVWSDSLQLWVQSGWQDRVLE